MEISFQLHVPAALPLRRKRLRDRVGPTGGTDILGKIKIFCPCW
jgi:hypothetical protein